MAALRRAATGLASPRPTTWTRCLALAHHQHQPRGLGVSLPPRCAGAPRANDDAAGASGRRSCRRYHSYDHPPAARGPFNDTETKILEAAYRHVPELGFSEPALSRGAKDAGYLGVSTAALQDGAFSLIRYHLVTRREALAARAGELFGLDRDGAVAGAEGSSDVRVPERVERLTWERLMGNKDIVHKWQEALAIMAQPSFVPASLKELSMLADEIWFLAGDTSVDPSWYTKRASLATIYASTELFMTNDKSTGFGETRDFLRRRFDEARRVSGLLGAVGEWVGFTANASVNVLRSKGVRI